MFDYQKQDSPQTLSEGITEYFEANQQNLNTRVLTPEATEFFRCHDVCHVVFGCDISLSDEAVVKINSIFGTSAGWRVIKGYNLPESKEVYEALGLADIVHTAMSCLYLIPQSIWRCSQMHERWHWDNFEDFLDIPLHQIREKFGIKVAH
jgi:ubiquinone biosynthesis protein Coq4